MWEEKKREKARPAPAWMPFSLRSVPERKRGEESPLEGKGEAHLVGMSLLPYAADSPGITREEKEGEEGKRKRGQGVMPSGSFVHF